MARMIGKSASTVQRWEEGDASPEPEALRALANCLGVRAEYFLRPSLKEDKPVFFRSQATALKRDKAYQRARIIWLQEVSHVLQHYVDLPVVDVPDLVGQRHFTTLTDDDLEGFAEHLRRYWQLGDGPCPNVVDLMERVGFVIASEDMDTNRLDGLCKWCSQEQRPYVLLASDKMSYARRQMDAAHEMAHAVLHRRVGHKDFSEHFDLIEKQAFRLASALLLPRKAYLAEARLPMLSALEVLKERWKASIKAQIWRLRELDAIPDDYAQTLFKAYSAKGWSKGEPFDDSWPLQQPRALAEACNAVVDAKVRSKKDLLHLDFALPAADVESLCALPRGWFDSEQGPIVKLIPRATDSDPQAGGRVLPFKGKGDDQ